MTVLEFSVVEVNKDKNNVARLRLFLRVLDIYDYCFIYRLLPSTCEYYYLYFYSYEHV